MISLRNMFLFIFCATLASCASMQNQKRNPSSDSCWEKVKPEYQSYFDSVEKCIENKDQK